MKILRSTYWSPELQSTTVVVSEKDVIVPLEEISHPPDGFAFIKDDIWEVPDDTIPPIFTLEASQRLQDNMDRERNQAILFFWMFGNMAMTSNNGHIIALKAAPLSADELRTVFRQLMDLPQYSGQTLFSLSEDGTGVQMKDGVNA